MNKVPTPKQAYDASDWEQVKGVTNIDQAEYWGGDIAAFISSPPGWGGPGWVGQRPLGQGGFGTAALWVKYDENGTVIDTMVIKESLPREFWCEEPPVEVDIMEELSAAKCDNILRLLGYRRYRAARKHRLYMEFCPYGDLRRLIKRYRAWRQYLPEPFLWDAFHGLTQAMLCLRQRNTSLPVRELSDRDTEIVHRDVKPDNIFLGYEKPTHRYPTLKLADFGLAIRTSRADAGNPDNYVGSGTRGYKADEQQEEYDLYDWLKTSQGKLASWTNIWGVGAIMYELMTLIPVKRTYMKGIGNLPSTNTRRPDYSSELRDLIQECLNARPEKRADLRKLYETTKIGMDRSKRAGQSRKNRLYYRGAEINQMPLGDREPMPFERTYKPSVTVRTRFLVSDETRLRVPRPNGTYEEYTDDIEEESSSLSPPPRTSFFTNHDDDQTIQPNKNTIKPRSSKETTDPDADMEDFTNFYGPKNYEPGEQTSDPSFDDQMTLDEDDEDEDDEDEDDEDEDEDGMDMGEDRTWGDRSYRQTEEEEETE